MLSLAQALLLMFTSYVILGKLVNFSGSLLFIVKMESILSVEMHLVDILCCIENHGASMLGKLKIYKNIAQTMKKKNMEET